MNFLIFSAYTYNTSPWRRRTFEVKTPPTSYANRTFIFYYGTFPESQYPGFPAADRLELTITNPFVAKYSAGTDGLFSVQVHTSTGLSAHGPVCIQDAGIALAAPASGTLPIRSYAQKTELLLNPEVAKKVKGTPSQVTSILITIFSLFISYVVREGLR